MRRSGHRVLRILTPAIVALLVLAGGAAIVGAQDGDETYYACRTASSGMLYKVSSDSDPSRCSPGDDLIQWNVGGQGEPGLTWQGEWDSDTTYAAGDAVSYDGASWISTTDGNTTTPDESGSEWDLLSAKGDKGDPGADGQDGKDGEPGLVWRGAWDDSTVYETGDAVSHNGSAWISIANDNESVPGEGDSAWDLLADQGQPGQDGDDGQDGEPGLVWRGTWSSGTTYQENDVVSHLGSSWVSTADENDTEPGASDSDWDQLASRGEDGADGVPGEPGAPGEPGEPGEPGLVWQGLWEESVPYANGDAVSHAGASWISTTDDNTSEPGVSGSTWDMLAAPGAQGATGPTGEPGPGVPEGGVPGEVLTKSSDEDFATMWSAPPAAVPTVTVRTNSSSSSSQFVSITVACATGEYAIAGGGTNSGSWHVIRDSFPSNTNGTAVAAGSQNPPAWTVVYGIPGSSSATGTKTAYAICVQGPANP